MPKAQMERRTIQTEVEVRQAGSKVYIEGYAAVFGKRSGNLGGFVEEVGSTAFTKTLQEADIRALWNHDPNQVLGRVRAGTLEMSTDTSGLYYRATPPDTSYANDLMKLLERRDVNQSSFQFWKVQDDWKYDERADLAVRTLIEVGLIEVSPVTFPAYEDATSGIGRSAALDGLSKRSGLSIVDLADDEAIKKAIRDGRQPGTESASEPLKDTPSTVDESRTTDHREFKKFSIEELDALLNGELQ